MVNLISLKSHPAIKDATFAVTGNIVGSAISGIALILMSRTLGPEKYGVFSVGFSLMVIAARLAEGGMIATLLKYFPNAKSPQEENKLFWASLQFKLLLGVGLGVAMSISSPWIAGWLHVPTEMVLLVAWFNLITLVFDHLAGLSMAMLKIKYAVMANFVQALIKLGVAGLTFVNPALSAVSVLTAYMAAPGPVTLLYKRFLSARIWKRPKRLPWEDLYHKVRSMAGHNWLAGISGAVVQNVDVLIVSSFLPGLEVGYVGAAARIAMFVAIVGSSLAGVVNPRVAKLQNHESIKRYWGNALLLLLLTLIGALVLPLLSGFILQATTGTEYLPAAGVLSWMLVATCFSIGLTPFAALFFRYHQPSFFSISALAQGLIMCVGGYFAVQSFGMEAVGWVRVASQSVMLLLTVSWAVAAHRKEFGKLPWK